DASCGLRHRLVLTAVQLCGAARVQLCPSGGVTLCRAGGATSGRVLGREQPDDAREPTTESVAPVREERLVLAGTARQPGDRDARRLQLLDHAGGDVDRRGAGA